MQKISKNTCPARDRKGSQRIFISNGIKDTGKIAKIFLEKINPNKKGATIVGLYGELGTGKTAFTQATAKLLGIKRKINSPTFVIMKNYTLTQTLSRREGGFHNLIHIDAYRLKNEKELWHLGWKEIISNPEHLIFIEWPENIIKAMPKKHHQIFISHTKNGYRNFKFNI